MLDNSPLEPEHTEEPEACIYLVDAEEECDNCSNKGVVTLLYASGELHSMEMCGVCTWGEAKCLNWDEWSLGEVTPEMWSLTDETRSKLFASYAKLMKQETINPSAFSCGQLALISCGEGLIFFDETEPPEGIGMVVLGFDDGCIEYNEKSKKFVDSFGEPHCQYHLDGDMGPIVVITPRKLKNDKGKYI